MGIYKCTKNYWSEMFMFSDPHFGSKSEKPYNLRSWLYLAIKYNSLSNRGLVRGIEYIQRAVV